jgi:hypothetical protein
MTVPSWSSSSSALLQRLSRRFQIRVGKVIAFEKQRLPRRFRQRIRRLDVAGRRKSYNVGFRNKARELSQFMLIQDDRQQGGRVNHRPAASNRQAVFVEEPRMIGSQAIAASPTLIDAFNPRNHFRGLGIGIPISPGGFQFLPQRLHHHRRHGRNSNIRSQASRSPKFTSASRCKSRRPGWPPTPRPSSRL